MGTEETTNDDMYVYTDIPVGQYNVSAYALDANGNQTGFILYEILDVFKDLKSTGTFILNEGILPPSTASSLYNGTSISIANACTLKVIAVKEGLVNSDVTEETFFAHGKAGFTVTSPSYSNDIKIKRDGNQLYAKSASISEPLALSWNINGVDSFATATLLEGDNQVRVKVTISDGKMSGQNSVENNPSSAMMVSLSSILNYMPICMVPVLTTETTISGSGDEGVFITGRDVTLSPYEISKYEVTQQQFLRVMNHNPSMFYQNPYSGEVQELRPVEQVSWYDAVIFCNELTRLDMTCIYNH